MQEQILTLSICIILAILLVYAQKVICKKHKNYMMMLPILWLMFTLYNSIPNFEKAFYLQFSLGAFVASIVYFILLNIPTMVMLMIVRNVKNNYETVR